MTERSQRGSGTTFQYTYDHLAQVTQDAFENGEFAPLQAAVVDAIAVCHTSDELWSLLSIEGLDEATFVEDEHPPQVAEAILARADSWGETADAASAVALLVRMSAFDPAPMLLPTMDDGVKDKVASVLDACAERLAAYLGSPCAPMRASCAHALGRCRTATVKQAKALLHLAASEVDPSARAAMLLSAGAISRRRGESVGVIDGNTSHPSQLVRGCAAAACALAGETLGDAGTASLAALVAAPSDIPDEWGWRWQNGTESTVAIGERVFGWVRTDAPGVAIGALAAITKPTWHVPGCLGHLAFDDGAIIPRTGLARDELADVQLKALRAFARPMQAMTWLSRFCIYDEGNVLPFLDGTPPHWKPLEVAWEGGRRWHLWRTWREHVWGVLPRDVAARAIIDGLGRDAVLAAITVRFHGVYRTIAGGVASETEPARDAGLIVEIVETLAKVGAEPMPELLRLAAEADLRDAPTLTIALLAAARACHAEIPESLDPLLRTGVALASSPAPFTALLSVLPNHRRQTIAQAG